LSANAGLRPAKPSTMQTPKETKGRTHESSIIGILFEG
jgi:hypothetical protein